MVLALHELKKKLSHYFQVRRIIVLTFFPIHNILSKFDYAGRIGRWTIPLAPYDIEYRARSSIKGQVLADFLLPEEVSDGPLIEELSDVQVPRIDLSNPAVDKEH